MDNEVKMDHYDPKINGDQLYTAHEISGFHTALFRKEKSIGSNLRRIRAVLETTEA